MYRQNCIQIWIHFHVSSIFRLCLTQRHTHAPYVTWNHLLGKATLVDKTQVWIHLFQKRHDCSFVFIYFVETSNEESTRSKRDSACILTNLKQIQEIGSPQHQFEKKILNNRHNNGEGEPPSPLSLRFASLSVCLLFLLKFEPSIFPSLLLINSSIMCLYCQRLGLPQILPHPYLHHLVITGQLLFQLFHN